MMDGGGHNHHHHHNRASSLAPGLIRGEEEEEEDLVEPVFEYALEMDQVVNLEDGILCSVLRLWLVAARNG
jgi:hypothetical protein